jgi:hypothetical protein
MADDTPGKYAHSIANEIVAALTSEPQAPWQPIETAPKDGTEIDVWVLDARRAIPTGRRYTNAKWHGYGWQWFDPYYGDVGAYVGLDNGVNVRVTHWMSAPTAPVTRPVSGGAA